MVKGPWGIPCQNNVREEGWKRVLLGDTTLEKRIMELGGCHAKVMLQPLNTAYEPLSYSLSIPL